jgi:hypothetical protein
MWVIGTKRILIYVFTSLFSVLDVYVQRFCSSRKEVGPSFYFANAGGKEDVISRQGVTKMPGIDKNPALK